MKSFEYTITDPIGFHARPAGMLVKAAAKFASNIEMECEGKKVNAKKLIAIMGAGIKQGQKVVVSIEGEDEEAAFAEIEKFFKENA